MRVKITARSVELVGPMGYHALIVDGRAVPHLTAAPRNGGLVELVLDDRISVDVQVANLERIGGFVADCIAVAMGYTEHPRDGADAIVRPPFPRWTPLALA